MKLEYIINSDEKLSIEQLLIIYNKALKMKFDDKTILKVKNKLEKELNKINSLYEIKRIKKNILSRDM